MITEAGVIWQAGFTGGTNRTWSGNVVFCCGYHCSSLCMGCILPWLLMLCRSTLLLSEWWTNRQWFSPRKSAVFYCFHVSCCLFTGGPTPPGATHAIYRVYFLLSTSWGGILYTPEEENTPLLRSLTDTEYFATWIKAHRTWIYLFFYDTISSLVL